MNVLYRECSLALDAQTFRDSLLSVDLRALFRKYVANSFQFTVLHCTYHSFHFGILRRNPTYIIYFHVVINSECIIVFLWVLLFHHNWIWFSIVSTFNFSFQTCLKKVPIINRLYLFCSWSWCYFFFVFHCWLFCCINFVFNIFFFCFALIQISWQCFLAALHDME